MNLLTHVGAHAQQRLAILPKMLQSIEVLRLPSIDLLAYVEQQLASNDALSVESPRKGELREPRRRAAAENDAKHDMLQNLADRGGGLRRHLLEQLVWHDLSVELRGVVEVLIGALDERGLLPLEDDDLAALVGRDRLEEALAVVRSLEPAGVGARSAVEAMLLQVPETDPDFDRIRALLCEHLDELARNRLEEVARAIESTVEELELLVARMARLDPRPGAAYTTGSAEPVRPDVVVERDGEDFRLVVDDASIPVLALRADQAARVADPCVDRSLRSHLRDELRGARDVIDALSMRRETLARVARATLRRQPGFLESGRPGIAPLKMSTIADELGVHNSTVSRAIAGKYVQTDHGVFALRELFDGGHYDKPVSPGNDGKGRVAILHEIRTLIADEDEREPLSDDGIAARLADSGVSISRRTVAKYRQEMGIRSSWHRRGHRNR